MNIERLYKVVLMDLTSQQLKIEDELELTINSAKDVNEKSRIIRNLISELVTVENSITKFTGMITQINNNELKKDKDE